MRPDPNPTDDSPQSSMTEHAAPMAAEDEQVTQIDAAMIDRLVGVFYARAREDAVLGPVFNRHVEDWPAHLVRIGQFWASVMLSTGAYSGSPMQRHAPLPIGPEHFHRWLALFECTAREVCPPASADRFVDAAQRMARSLQLARAPLPQVRSGTGTDVGSTSTSKVSASARITALRAFLPEPGDDAK